MTQRDDRSGEWEKLEDNRKHWLNEREKCKKQISSYQAQFGHPPEDKLQELEKIDQELKRTKQQERPILRQLKRS
jgi:hypothetical protein